MTALFLYLPTSITEVGAPFYLQQYVPF